MALDTQTIETRADDWSIPLWFKLAITFFTLSAGATLFLAVGSGQRILLGLSTTFIIILSLVLVLIFSFTVLVVWFFPNGAFAGSIYWLARYLRRQICVFSLLGAVILLTIRTPFFSWRGGIPLLNLVALFLISFYLRPVEFDRSPLPWMNRLSGVVKRAVRAINSIPPLLLSLVVALLPILIVCLVIYFGLNSSLRNYGPYSFWNDETSYWLWLRSFGHAGLDVGYNAPNELTAPAAFNRYGEGSPLYLYIYGSIARLTGWSAQLPISINFALLALAIFSFTYFTELDPVQIIFTGLITALTWPILLYLPMTTHETVNQAIGFIIAIIFYVLLTKPDKLSLPIKVLFVFVIYFATLIRLSWGLMLIPVIFYALNRNVFGRVIFSLSLGLCLFVSAILITNYLVPPANNSILARMGDSSLSSPQLLFEYVIAQFRQMFRFKELNPNIAVMFQIVVIIGWNLTRIFRLIRSKLSATTILQSPSVFDIYNTATLVVAGLSFYIQEGFYRTFTPALLVVYLLQAARRDYRLLTTLLAINIIFFQPYMTFYAHVGDYEIIRSDFTTEFPERAKLQAEVQKLIVFEPSAQNPWCNTLLIPLEYYDYRLMVIPPGIGISYILDSETFTRPVKSKYLLLDTETYELLDDRTDMKAVASWSIGDLYYNLDSGCNINP